MLMHTAKPVANPKNPRKGEVAYHKIHKKYMRWDGYSWVELREKGMSFGDIFMSLIAIVICATAILLTWLILSQA